MKQLDNYKYKTSIPFFRWMYSDAKHNNIDSIFNKRGVLPEIILALILVTSFNSWGQTTQTIGNLIAYLLWVIIVFMLFTLALVNGKTMLLPNALVKPLIFAIILFQIIIAMQTNNVGVFGSALLGSVVLGGIPYLFFQISAGKWIGGGDVKVGFAAGLLLGWKLGLFCLAVLFSLFMVSFLAEYIGSKASKAHLQARIPTGVMWVSSIFISVVIGQQFIN